MPKVITIPDHTTEIPRADGSKESKRTFLFLIGNVIENVPQKTDTETYLAHAIREKIDSTRENQSTLTLEESEIDFLRGGVKKLREGDRVVGSLWYYLIGALQDAVDEKKFAKLKLAKNE